MFFVFLGSLDNPKSMGTNNLIKDIGKIVTCPEDIISNYKFLHKRKIENNKSNKEKLVDISEEYKEIYQIITKKPIDINEIVKLSSNKNLKEVMAKLTFLELENRIRKVSGNRYIRCE